MSLLYTIAAFLLALGVLIVVHEFGHYLAARACGVMVLRFSIGFGRPIWKRRFSSGGTEWVVAMLPLGGYVKMLDQREGEVAPQDLRFAFNLKNVWQRFFIVAAGPLANFLLAIFLYWLLFIGGVPDARPLIGTPPPNTMAALAGFERGDTLSRIGDLEVRTWQDARWRLLQLAVDKSSAEIEIVARSGDKSRRSIDLKDFDIEGLEEDPVARMGFRLYRPDAVIGGTLPGSVAERAGLRREDRVLAIDNRPISTWDEFVLAVRSKPGDKLLVRIANNSGESTVPLVPEAVTERGKKIGRVGAEPLVNADEAKSLYAIFKYGPGEAVAMALAKTWDTSIFSLRMIGRMITGDVSLRNLSGPVTIADYAGQSAQAGWIPYLAFLAIVSISLGVLNLLPVPLLDGGHLMYYVAEIVIGRPVSENVMEIGQRIGLAVLLMLMAFALYNDFNRLFSG